MKPQPCPFCRTSKNVAIWHVASKHHICCCSCYAAGPYRTTERESIKAWNRIRVEPVKKARKR